MGETRKPILVNPPAFLKKNFKEYMVSTYKQSYYTKSGKGYKFYCKCCGKIQYFNKNDFKKIKMSNLCPNCYRQTKIHTKPFPKNFEKHDLFGWKDNKGNKVGYICQLTEDSFFIKQVAYWTKNSKGKEEFWARYIQKFMGIGISYSELERPDFTKRHSSSYGGWFGCLEGQFQWIMEGNERRYGLFYEARTYKEYLKDTVNIDTSKFKSNQLYLIKNNLLNSNQVKAIYYFDLKSIDELYKYNSYINKCSFTKARLLNIHYLDYLNRNHIHYSNYMDYADDMEFLGYKLDKPKDFYDRHQKVGELIEIKKNDKYRVKIEKRFEDLKIKELDSKNYIIKPIESLDEIYYVAKSLHNCMSRLYTRPYAEGETDLYCLWKDEKPFIAIEVLNGELEQVYADNNREPMTKYKTIVRKWYRNCYAR